MLTKNERLALTIARLHYFDDLSQGEIGVQLGLSRQKVNRLLKKAKEWGLVQINLASNTQLDLESQLRDLYALKEVEVVDAREATLADDIGRAAAELLIRRASMADVVGVSWGNTLSTMIPWLNRMPVTLAKKKALVQLNGSLTRSFSPTNAGVLFESLSRVLNAPAYQLPVPAVVESSNLRNQLTREPSIKNVLDLGRISELVVFSIGVPSTQSVLAQAGYIAAHELAELTDGRGAIGDICSRYFTVEGEIAWPDLDRRTIGIELEDLFHVADRLCIAFGSHKQPAVSAALRKGYITSLIVDQTLAEGIINAASHQLTKSL